jgi:hypothetical protein
MSSIKRFGAFLCTLFVIFSLLASLPVKASNGAADQPYTVVITGIYDDYGLDTTGDGLYDYLVVGVTINTTLAGTYGLESDLYFINKNCGWNYTTSLLSGGANIIWLRFNAEYNNYMIHTLYERNISFSVKFHLEFIDNKSIGTDKTLRLLKHYSSADFSYPGIDGSGDRYIPTATIEENAIKIQTDVFEAVINTTFPEVVFYYSQDNGTSARFKVAYQGLIAYNSTSNFYDGGMPIYRGNFTDSKWRLDGITYSGNLYLGRFLQFQISTNSVQLKKDNEIVNGTIVFKYTIASRSTNISNFYVLKGGVELKIDMEFELPLLKDVTDIAIEQILSDETNKHSYTLVEADGNKTVKTGDEVRQFSASSVPIQKIGFTDANGIEHGYYAWSSNAIGYNETNYANLSVSASYKIENNKMKLYLSYPYSKETRKIIHDPSVGVNENQIPQIGAVIIEFIKHNPYAYALGSISALVIIAFTIYIRKKESKEE